MDVPPPESSPELQPLRFAIVDEEDLSVMSAHLQDAVLTVAEMAFLPQAGRFAAVASRIDWPSLADGRQARRQAGFHFDRVRRVRRSGFEQSQGELSLQLLAVSFRTTDAPAGEVLLTFAGGRMIKLDVECLEAEMRDLSECWPVRDCPRHHLDAGDAAG